MTGWLTGGRYFYGVDSIRLIDRRIEGIGFLAMHWLEDCAGPGWCGGSDVSGDGVDDFRYFVMVEGWLEEDLTECLDWIE